MPLDKPCEPRAGPPDWVGLAGALATVGLHFILQADGPNLVFIVGVCLFWGAFVVFRAARDPSVFQTWGFRADNLAAASAAPAALFVFIASAFAIYAIQRDHLRVPPHLPLLFLLYPVYGVMQQFLVLGVVVGSLERLPLVRSRRWVLTVPMAALFGLIHAPDLRLVAATFALEVVIIPLYLRHRNLWPLGVLHGWLGGLFYLWVLNRDLLAENFS